MSIREPAVAGQFYPGDSEALKRMLASFFSKKRKQAIAREAIVPHAGYIYSGAIAAESFVKLKASKTFVILCPNHTGLGSEIAVSASKRWITPLGHIEVDTKLAEEIVASGSASFDELAHIGEHSAEVQVPFIQYLFKNAKILPITIGTDNFEVLLRFAESLVKASRKNCFSLIASSDFSHFVPLKYAKEKDMKAIEFIKKLDVEGFYNYVLEQRLSICGYAPITVTLHYCKMKRRKKAVLLKYDTSAKVTRDEANVVGYASIIFV